jgi:hypothetical protein
VATLGRRCTNYFSAIRKQEGRHAELVSMKVLYIFFPKLKNFQELAIDAIRAFIESTPSKKAPEYILVYRDGVGDSQMDAVVTHFSKRIHRNALPRKLLKLQP